jgi:heme/copper-type cytochrome/quinol oxidase subunit 2
MDYRRRLLWHGIALFLIGLFTGLAEQHFANIRMALAAHLEGVMNGTFLIAVVIGLAIISASVLLLWGLRRKAAAP